MSETVADHISDEAIIQIALDTLGHDNKEAWKRIKEAVRARASNPDELARFVADAWDCRKGLLGQRRQEGRPVRGKKPPASDLSGLFRLAYGLPLAPRLVQPPSGSAGPETPSQGENETTVLTRMEGRRERRKKEKKEREGSNSPTSCVSTFVSNQQPAVEIDPPQVEPRPSAPAFAQPQHALMAPAIPAGAFCVRCRRSEWWTPAKPETGMREWRCGKCLPALAPMAWTRIKA